MSFFSNLFKKQAEEMSKGTNCKLIFLFFKLVFRKAVFLARYYLIYLLK